MSVETKNLIDLYLAWLRERSSEQEIEGGWTMLTLPFLDRHNDHLRVYARRGSDGLYITDDGQIIRDLKQIGCDLKAHTKRRSLAEKILKGLGLNPAVLDEGDLSTTAVNGEFPRKLNSLLLSMMSIDGLANISQATVAALFRHDVIGWLSTIGADFEEEAKYKGKSGIEHEFDFLISPKPNARAKVLHSIANPDRMHIQSFAYEVIDTREALNGDSPEFYAILNDRVTVSKKQYMALLAHEITPLRWTKRNEHAKKFA